MCPYMAIIVIELFILVDVVSNESCVEMVTSSSTTPVVVVGSCVVVVAATARPGAGQNWGWVRLGLRLPFPKSGPSARVHTVEGTGKPIATIHIGDRYLSHRSRPARLHCATRFL